MRQKHHHRDMDSTKLKSCQVKILISHPISSSTLIESTECNEDFVGDGDIFRGIYSVTPPACPPPLWQPSRPPDLAQHCLPLSTQRPILYKPPQSPLEPNLATLPPQHLQYASSKYRLSRKLEG